MGRVRTPLGKRQEILAVFDGSGMSAAFVCELPSGSLQGCNEDGIPGGDISATALRDLCESRFTPRCGEVAGALKKTLASVLFYNTL